MDMSWALDIFCVFMVFTSVYLGFKRGLILGLYNLIASLIITIVAVHNYIAVTEFIKKRFSVMPSLYGDFLSFSILVTVCLLIAFILRGFLSFFASSEEMGKAERIFGAILGVFSGIIVTSLWMMSLYLSPWKGVESSVSNGAFSKRLVFLPGYIYSISIDYIIRPVDKDFKVNMMAYSPSGSKEDKKSEGKTTAVSNAKKEEPEALKTEATNETKEITDATK